MEIYYQPNLSNHTTYLPEEESKHCVRVLRRKPGDRIVVVDGKGTKIEAEITDANPKKCGFRILSEHETARKGFIIQIALAPTKSIDRTEWFVEKAVEIGVDSINFYFGKHSERRKINLDRVVKKAIGAMKQSGQAFLPQINTYDSLRELLKDDSTSAQRFIAFVDFENQDHLMDLAEKGSSIIVLIGPEGDFSKDELQLALDSGYSKVSLGNNRLRTETAGLAACHILNLVNR